MGRRAVLVMFACGLVAAFMAPGLVAAQSEGGAAAVVTPNIQVTQDIMPGRIWTEPQMLADPRNPNTLVIATPEFNTATCYTYLSRDRGRTWAKNEAKIVPPGYQSCVRPNFGAFFHAKFGLDGTLYVAGTAAATGTNAGPNDPFVARSRDLGKTWQYTIVKKSEERDFPKPDGTTARDFERFGYVRLAVSPTNPDLLTVGFRRQGAFLPVSQVSERTMIAVSNDGGVTFGPLTDIFESSFPLTEVKGTDQPGMGIGGDGTIYAFTKERPPPAPPSAPAAPTQGQLPLPPGPAVNCKPSSSTPGAPEWRPTPTTVSPPQPGGPGAGARLLMSKSTDGGKTWSAKVADASGIVCIPCLTTPEAAVDPKTGDVYVVWEQSDSGPPNPRDDRNIWFMKSTDGGETFSSRVQLNDDRDAKARPNYDQMFPGISLAPNGRIDIAWWDFRTDALYNSAGNGNTTRRDATCFDIFYTSSSDRGTSWAANSRVSDRSMNQWEGLAMNPYYDLRGPVGVASTDAEAYVAWSDSRNGAFELPTEDVYMATVIHGERAAAKDEVVKASSVFLGLAIGLLVAGIAVMAVSARMRTDKTPAV